MMCSRCDKDDAKHKYGSHTLCERCWQRVLKAMTPVDKKIAPNPINKVQLSV